MQEQTTSIGTIIGKKAPDFEVQGYFKGELKTFKLSDYTSKGKWVYLLFYPLDFTFVCPTEVLSFSKHAAEFEKRGCQLLGFSVDSQFTHKAWVDSKAEDGGLGGSLNYPLLADINKTVAASYGTLNEAAGVALRGLFLIDPQGVVMQATINNLSVGRSATEALRILKAFQYVAAHEGEVCPADWDEGEDTMKASSKGMQEYLKTH
jgi:peroxiredoxin (alkyl hydroperoxide reductase subunit C)